MGHFTSLDFKDILTNTTSGIFDTMLSMEIETVGSDSFTIPANKKVIGTVGFGGDVTGCMNIHVSTGFAQLIAANMLGEDPDKIETEDVLDALGELSNMIGGEVKSRLCDAGATCSLSIPSTMCGSNFKVESHGWIMHERVAFRNNEYFALVEVYVK
jgi:CheY-specific phosphatase CheX